MPVSATDLLKKLMAKAGVTYDGDFTTDIPDDVATSLDNQLLTIAAATNNHPLVRNFYTAQVYNGVDAELNRIMAEMNLPEDVKQEILQAGISQDRPNGSTTKRIAALTKKIKDLNNTAAPVDKEAVKKFNDTIAELNGKLSAEIKKQEDLKTGFEKQVKQIEVKTKLGGILSGYKTIYDDIPEAKEPAIQALLNKALQDSDADFAFDDKGNLSLLKKDGSNLFGDNHTLITPQSFIDKTLSKILKVTGATPPNTPAQPVPGSQPTQNTVLDAALDEALASYATGSKQAVVI